MSSMDVPVRKMPPDDAIVRYFVDRYSSEIATISVGDYRRLTRAERMKIRGNSFWQDWEGLANVDAPWLMAAPSHIRHALVRSDEHWSEDKVRRAILEQRKIPKIGPKSIAWLSAHLGIEPDSPLPPVRRCPHCGQSW